MWPTPSANKITQSGEVLNSDGTPWDGKSKPHNAKGQPIQTALTDAVRLWPTPKAKQRGDCPAERRRKYPNLESEVKTRYATPQARDFRTGSKKRFNKPKRTKNLDDQIGGQLNPTWVEWLVGLPFGWTVLDALEISSYRNRRSRRGKKS